jgi:hypothetical protein
MCLVTTGFVGGDRLNRIGRALVVAAAASVAGLAGCDPGGTLPYTGWGAGKPDGTGAPADTGGSAACSVGNDNLHLHGPAGSSFWDSAANGGDLDVATQWGPGATWSALFGDANQISIEVTKGGLDGAWAVDFATPASDSHLAPGDYQTDRSLFIPDAVAISGAGMACSTISTRFRIDESSMTASGTITSFTGSFLFICDGDETNWLQGCVHYAAR